MKTGSALFRYLSAALMLLIILVSCFGCGKNSGDAANTQDRSTAKPSGEASNPPEDASDAPSDETTGGREDPPPAPVLVTEISTYDDLVAFAASVNAGNHYQGITVKLNQDIRIDSTKGWTPIGWGEKMLTNSLGQPMNFSPWFGGTFDG